MTGRLKRHYVVVDVEGSAAYPVYELDPNLEWRRHTYRLWLDDLSRTRAIEVAAAMNALESSRAKARRAAAAARRKNATT